MPRLPRFFVPDLPLHIIQRGNDRQPIFAARDDVMFYRDCLARATREYGVAIHAYVLMTNHVHFLATPRLAVSVPKMMQSIGRIYVQYFNRTHRRTGTLWEGRYKAAIVDDERYLLTCMRYIELNPVRAHMVVSPGEFPGRVFQPMPAALPTILSSRTRSIDGSVRRRRPAGPRIASCSARRYPRTRCTASAMRRSTRGR